MKTILVPTDYSQAANNALNYAIELAKQDKAKIILFHAYHVPMPTGEVPVMLVHPDELEKENLDRIKKLEKEIAKKIADEIKVEHIVRAGFIPDEIVSLVKEKNISLIVMGVKGESKLSRVLMGSNTVAVMKKTQIPVLAIPSDCKFKKPAKIVLAYDFNAPLSKEILKKLKNFILLFKSKLLVLDVVKQEEVPVYDNAVAGLKLENSLRDIEHSLYFPEGVDVVEEINSFVEAYKADWLVMIPHKHKLLSSLFHQSNTKKMTFHTRIPLLSLHE